MYYLVGKNGFVVIAYSGIDYRTPHMEIATSYTTHLAAKIMASRLDEAGVHVVHLED